MGAAIIKILKSTLYIFILPICLIVIPITAVLGLFIILYMFIKSIFCFFSGRTIHDDLPEDIKLKAILHPETNEQNNPVPNNPDSQKPMTYNEFIEKETFGEIIREPKDTITQESETTTYKNDSSQTIPPQVEEEPTPSEENIYYSKETKEEPKEVEETPRDVIPTHRLISDDAAKLYETNHGLDISYNDKEENK